MHYPQTIKPHPRSYALLSDQAQTDTAVVFVHGFGGGARKTWVDFQGLIDQCAKEFPWWNTCDAFFYQYSSGKKPVAVSAQNLSSFIQYIFPQPSPDLFKLASELLAIGVNIGTIKLRPGEPLYRNLVLVGHSEGAVVVRRAIVEHIKMLRENQDVSFPNERSIRESEPFLSAQPMLAATVILFSPACLGASCSGWVGALLSICTVAKFVNPILNSFPAYIDLQKGSPVLQQLKQDTETFAGTYGWIECLTARSYFGADDKTVFFGEYQTDPPSVYVEGHNHISVCKPRLSLTGPGLSYKEPLKIVRYERKRRVTAA